MDELEFDQMGKIYSKMSGPWFVRNMTRNQTLKNIDVMVTNASKQTWSGLVKVVGQKRPKLEPAIRGLLDPLQKFEKSFHARMEGLFLFLLFFFCLKLYRKSSTNYGAATTGTCNTTYRKNSEYFQSYGNNFFFRIDEMANIFLL